MQFSENCRDEIDSAFSTPLVRYEIWLTAGNKFWKHKQDNGIYIMATIKAKESWILISEKCFQFHHFSTNCHVIEWPSLQSFYVY